MSRPEPLFVVHASSGVPIYRQLVDQVEALVAGGRLRPGDVVPSVRQVATALGINPMTVSKAWGRLESDGVLIRDRGRGMVVAMPQLSRLVSLLPPPRTTSPPLPLPPIHPLSHETYLFHSC